MNREREKDRDIDRERQGERHRESEGETNSTDIQGTSSESKVTGSSAKLTEIPG